MPKQKSAPDPKLVFRVAEIFFGGESSVSAIARQINQGMDSKDHMSRESVYPLLALARKYGFVRLVAPIEGELAKSVAEKFRCQGKRIEVVRTTGKHLNHYVAARAAEVTLELIRKIAIATGQPVGLGLGPGRATLDFSRHLGHLMQNDIDARPIKLFAIGAGCPARSPEYSSTSFFNLFPTEMVAERVGLFAETVVRSNEFEDIKKRPGVCEAFKSREDVSIVVTSMGDFHDNDDLLTTFLRQAGETPESFDARGLVGSVQYRPYTKTGPATEEPTRMRAVTLFELEDFVRMAGTKGKHVVLIARQCGACGKTRAAALRPLLRVPSLNVWSELVMDEATARDLLDDKPEATREATSSLKGATA